MTGSVVLPVTVPAVAATRYPVHVGVNLAAAVAATAGTGDLRGRAPVVVTDAWCATHLAPEVLDAFEEHGPRPEVVAMPPGEAHKTRATKALLEDRLLDLGFGRDTVVVAVGGGVVTDMAGFVAATYLRGVLHDMAPDARRGDGARVRA